MGDPALLARVGLSLHDESSAMEILPVVTRQQRGVLEGRRYLRRGHGGHDHTVLRTPIRSLSMKQLLLVADQFAEPALLLSNQPCLPYCLLYSQLDIRVKDVYRDMVSECLLRIYLLVLFRMPASVLSIPPTTA